MASCNHCGAPLVSNTNQCNYCGTRNDVDLRAKFPYKLEQAASSRTCPLCEIPLQTIRSTQDEKLFIERCEKCFGLFFDRGELEYVLQQSVFHVYDINREHIDNINKDRYSKPADFTYRKCPECAVLMNRVNFGHRSGVVVDQCLIHGIWLDNGELTHLMEWKKAGGQLLHQQTETLKKQRSASKPKAPLPSSATIKQNQGSGWDHLDGELGWDVLEALGWLIAKLFFGNH
jgi:Zn-finger nucleic acid-binding protein